MPEIKIASIFYGRQEWCKRNEKFFVKMFGTNGPGQLPHWFWGEVSPERVPDEVKKALQ